jgi:hypothetical protein
LGHIYGLVNHEVIFDARPDREGYAHELRILSHWLYAGVHAESPPHVVRNVGRGIGQKGIHNFKRRAFDLRIDPETYVAHTSSIPLKKCKSIQTTRPKYTTAKTAISVAIKTPAERWSPKLSL